MKKLWEPHFGACDLEIKQEENLISGHFEIKRLTFRHKMFDGHWSPWIQREQIQPDNSVAVILYDPQEDKVVMVEQIRIGAIGQQKEGPWLLEVVAGYIQVGEDPLESVEREVGEETGCTVKKVYPILQYYTTPGGLTEKTYVYCGIIDSHGVGGIHGSDDEHEDIKVHVLPALDVFKLLKGGMLTSSSSVIAIQWLEINRAHLQSVGYL